jgi:hypothetical protein
MLPVHRKQASVATSPYMRGNCAEVLDDAERRAESARRTSFEFRNNQNQCLRRQRLREDRVVGEIRYACDDSARYPARTTRRHRYAAQ